MPSRTEAAQFVRPRGELGGNYRPATDVLVASRHPIGVESVGI
jgi:hypothetical protein